MSACRQNPMSQMRTDVLGWCRPEMPPRGVRDDPAVAFPVSCSSSRWGCSCGPSFRLAGCPQATGLSRSNPVLRRTHRSSSMQRLTTIGTCTMTVAMPRQHAGDCAFAPLAAAAASADVPAALPNLAPLDHVAYAEPVLISFASAPTGAPPASDRTSPNRLIHVPTSNMSGDCSCQQLRCRRFAEPTPIVVVGTREAAEMTPNTKESVDAAKLRETTSRPQYRRRAALFAQPARPQAPHRRHPGAARHPHLGRRRERAQPDLCRRRAAVGADRQQQQFREPALGHGVAGGDQPRRRALRPVLGGLSRQFDRRGGQHHDADARQARGIGDLRRTACRASANMRPAASYPGLPAGGDDRRPLRPARLVHLGEPCRQQEPAARLCHGRSGCRAQRRRRAAFADLNRLGQPISVIGAGGFEHQRQDNLEAKLALDLAGRSIRCDLANRAVPQRHRRPCRKLCRRADRRLLEPGLSPRRAPLDARARRSSRAPASCSGR